MRKIMQVEISTEFDERKEQIDIEKECELSVSKKNGKIMQNHEKPHEKGLTTRRINGKMFHTLTNIDNIPI